MLRPFFVLAFCTIIFCGDWSFCQEAATPAAQDESEGGLEGTLEDKASFLLGFNMIENASKQGANLNLDKIIEGMKLAQSGGKLPVSNQDAMSIIRSFQRKVQADFMKKNKEEGEAFLAKNAEREGIKKLDNGVQYEVLTAGPEGGASPAKDDFVQVRYKGMLIDGSVFDQSGDSPAEFPVGGVIRGFSAALQAMKVGDKWKIFIPSDLAYGQRGSRGAIGPNATLIFEIELVGIKEKKDQ